MFTVLADVRVYDSGLHHEHISYQVSRFDGSGGILKEGKFVVSRNEQGKEFYEILDGRFPAPGGVRYFERIFISPTVKADCQSQVCLALKAADLGLALGTIAARLDVPFTSPDGVIPAPGLYVSGTVKVLGSKPVVDAALPFDTKN